MLWEGEVWSPSVSQEIVFQFGPPYQTDWCHDADGSG